MSGVEKKGKLIQAQVVVLAPGGDCVGLRSLSRRRVSVLQNCGDGKGHGVKIERAKLREMAGERIGAAN